MTNLTKYGGAILRITFVLALLGGLLFAVYMSEILKSVANSFDRAVLVIFFMYGWFHFFRAALYWSSAKIATYSEG